jgi:hypothetical protein
MRKLVVLVALLALSACNVRSSEADHQVDGPYTLLSVNGRGLPLDLGNDTASFLVTQAQLVLAPDGQWTQTLTGSVSANGQTVAKVVVERGRWIFAVPRVDLLSGSTGGPVVLTGRFSPYAGPGLELQRVDRSDFPRFIYVRTGTE